MIAVDTSALIAMLANEPEAPKFLRAILMADEAYVGTPTVFEFLMVAQSRRFQGVAKATSHVLATPSLRIVPWTEAHATLAQSAFMQFGKGRHRAKLNFGDCMSYALAKSLNAPLLYKGADFALTDIRSAV